jgi:hypothetical protein
LLLHAVAQADTLLPAPIQAPAVVHSMPEMTIALDSATHVAASSVVVLPLYPESQAHV